MLSIAVLIIILLSLLAIPIRRIHIDKIDDARLKGDEFMVGGGRHGGA